MEILKQFSNWNFYIFGSYPDGEPGGLLLNIILAILSLSFSFTFGVFLGYSRLSSRIYVKLPCIAYIETIRATPLVIIIFWFYYVIPYLFDINIPVFLSVLISLCIYASAYQAEIVRSGITAVPKSQLETALSSGMSRYTAMGYVILPQAFRMMIPSFVSFFVTLFKDTSTVFIIGVIELTQAGFIVSQRQPEKMFAAYFSVAVIYFLICNSLSNVAGKLEKKIGVFDFQSYRPDVSRDEFMLFPKYKLQTTPFPSGRDKKKKYKKYGMVIDLNKCIGCYACQVTCKAEYNIPYGIFRCNIETFQSGNYPDVKKFFMPRICNHCENPPCIEACEEKDAIFKTHEGIVLIDSNKCPKNIECKKCYELCPYDAIDLNSSTGKPEKCDFCFSRLQKGEQPVCAQSCMGKAITFGDINDKKSEISQILRRRQIKVLNPELSAYPMVFYLLNNSSSKYIPLKNYEIPRGRSVSKVAPKYALSDLTDSNLYDSPKKSVYTTCSMCPSECGISVLVENGTAKKIYGNPHSLVNNGTFCAKGAAGLQLTYSPHRIKTPLIRAGERGEDKWKPITWEEAADYVAQKLVGIKQKYGPETVFLNTGDMTDSIAYERLLHAFGTPNLYNHGSVCDPNRQWGQKLMLGDARPLPDVQRPLIIRNRSHEIQFKTKHEAKLILNIGVNPFVATRFNYMSNGITGSKIDNNCKYIVIDPSHTNSAAHADIWLPIIPGTDAAFLAGMLYYIIKNDSKDSPSKRYIDHDFIEQFTIGWPGFKKTFLSYTKKRDPSNKLYYFTLEWAEEKTGIARDDIKRVAHLFGIIKPAAIEIGMHGTAHHTNGDVTSILMVALCLITGNMDKPGGLVFISSQKPQKGIKTDGKEFLDKTVVRKVNGKEVTGKLSELHKDHYGDYPTSIKGVLTDLPRRIREGIKLKHEPFKGYSYPVKACITRGGNPVITAGSTPDWINALTAKDENGDYKLELMVYIDTHITVTGKYADIIFPEASFLERMGVSNVFTMSPEITLRDKAINPLYESKTPFEFMLYLSEALIKNGDPDIKAEEFTKKYKDEEDFINEILSNAPGFYNIGNPLPYPDLPEGCKIIGVPDNPRAVLGKKIIRHGELLTADWLRKHNGVAVWPTSYYRYKKSDGSPSGIYPKTRSKKFEFRFSYLDKINKKFGTNFPTTFYWSDCKWNPKNLEFKEVSKEYPFQLISGRVHHSMTMTMICPLLAETDTECMEPLNDNFQYTMPESNPLPNKYSLLDNKVTTFKAGSVSIPVFALNRNDGKRLSIKTGDIIILENPFKKKIKGKAFLTEEIMPGVIKTAFGPGGQKASGLGFINNTYKYTPNINELHDPENFNPFTGTPGFGDIMVKVLKVRKKL